MLVLVLINFCYDEQAKGATVIILDDIIQTGVTVTEMAKLAKSKGYS